MEGQVGVASADRSSDVVTSEQRTKQMPTMS